MTQRKGTISVNTEDILPIIKKWLYSEHDIFIRELVSNATDAITKRMALARLKNEEFLSPKIDVYLNRKEKTIIVSDNGIGMSESEIEKYLAQLASSGAKDFVERLKKDGKESKDDFIGKFGLGFYSTFMVADKVEVDSLSIEDGQRAVKWMSNGDTEYTFSDSSRTEKGTSIKLHINSDSEEFLDLYKLRNVLKNYCQFLPYKIELEDVDSKDQKEADIINDHDPIWKKDPVTLKDQDYISFYKTLFPFDQDPLFWIHLNVDHSFTLQGILYFPKLNPSRPFNESNIKLFCKQVFVSDNVKNIIPDFLSLLKGVIDSTDIPLNVSRSALQGDPNIKKISNYIVRKVSESLKKLFTQDRAKYESIWDDIGMFVKYGVTSDVKFNESIRDMVIFRNSDLKFITIKEYFESIPEAYKEKLKEKILYFEKDQADNTLRKNLKECGITSIETESYIDPHLMQYLEFHKSETSGAAKFVSIASEYENLLSEKASEKDDVKIKDLFQGVLIGEQNTDKKSNLEIEVKNLKSGGTVAYYKIDEQMKRFQQMTRTMGENPFNAPIKKTLVINPSSILVQNACKLWDRDDKKELARKICYYVKDLAQISSEGLKSDERDEFISRSQDLISELTNLAL